MHTHLTRTGSGFLVQWEKFEKSVSMWRWWCSCFVCLGCRKVFARTFTRLNAIRYLLLLLLLALWGAKTTFYVRFYCDFRVKGQHLLAATDDNGIRLPIGLFCRGITVWHIRFGWSHWCTGCNLPYNYLFAFEQHNTSVGFIGITVTGSVDFNEGMQRYLEIIKKNRI